MSNSNTVQELSSAKESIAMLENDVKQLGELLRNYQNNETADYEEIKKLERICLARPYRNFSV